MIKEDQIGLLLSSKVQGDAVYKQGPLDMSLLKPDETSTPLWLWGFHKGETVGPHFVRGPLNIRVVFNKKISEAQGRAAAGRSANPSLN